jgi:hypothetical protein
MFFIEGLMVGVSGPPHTDGIVNILMRQFDMGLFELDEIRTEIARAKVEFRR